VVFVAEDVGEGIEDAGFRGGKEVMAVDVVKVVKVAGST